MFPQLLAWLRNAGRSSGRAGGERPEVKSREPEWLRIRAILFEDWDPIPVNYNQNLVDEYDDYIPQVREALRRGIDEDGLTSLLAEIAVHTIGVKAEPERCRAAARKLVGVRVTNIVDLA